MSIFNMTKRVKMLHEHSRSALPAKPRLVTVPTRWGEWIPNTDPSTVCAGVTFEQTRTNNIGGSETRTVTGTKPVLWSDWTPDPSTIDIGVTFTQTRIDLNGCLPDETQTAVGTTPTESPTPTVTSSPTPTPTESPTPTVTSSPTPTPTPTPTRTPIPTPTSTPIPTPTSTAIVFLADYIVITYQFDSTNGLDLDSKTKLIAPIQSNTVGYCKSNDASPYLYWGGDNVGTGVESAYVDLTQFNANAAIQINCGGVWYNQRLNGNMSIDIRAYLGGTMVLNGYGFQNVGGTQTNFTSFAGNIALQSEDCSDGQTVGVISYNKATNQLTFTPS